jgi:hypothetical protein
MDNDPTNLTKDQLDFASKWFFYHADQRMKMFNFMLVVFGVLFTAVVTAINNEVSPFVEIVLCVVATELALAFCLLDRRNYKLVELGRNEKTISLKLTPNLVRRLCLTKLQKMKMRILNFRS